MIDSAHVKMHRSASGGKRGSKQSQSIGRSRTSTGRYGTILDHVPSSIGTRIGTGWSNRVTIVDLSCPRHPPALPTTWRLYDLIPTMREEWLGPLMRRFSQMLREEPLFADVFGPV